VIKWDERYSAEAFVFGTEPNRWLASQAPRIAPGGRVLCLGEGEGRNAVWLAGQGFRVEAVDGSAVGLEKARRLAAERGVAIGTTVMDLADFRPGPDPFDAVVLVFLHLPPGLREAVHRAAEASLRPAGVMIVEGFTPEQLPLTSGGPKQPDMLYTAALLRGDFAGISWDVLEESRVELDEGPGHQGPAAVVRGLGLRTA
jgi:2-polyprenyl-3-methyl-5-hydroxy-6-metoxy-1,4-benzoquinol methylase